VKKGERLGGRRTANDVYPVLLDAVDDALQGHVSFGLIKVGGGKKKPTSSAYVPLWSQVKRVHLSSRATVVRCVSIGAAVLLHGWFKNSLIKATRYLGPSFSNSLRGEAD